MLGRYLITENKMPTVKKVIGIISDFLKIGKSTAKSIQISGDERIAKRLKKFILRGDVAKIKKIVEKEGMVVDGKDVMGILKPKKPGEPNFIIISEDLLINYVWMKKMIRRYKRREG